MRRELRTALVTFLAAASAGWVLPLYLALAMLMAGIERVKLGDVVLDGLPFFPEARRMLLIACVWLVAVVFFWAFVGGYRLFDGRR